MQLTQWNELSFDSYLFCTIKLIFLRATYWTSGSLDNNVTEEKQWTLKFRVYITGQFWSFNQKEHPQVLYMAHGVQMHDCVILDKTVEQLLECSLQTTKWSFNLPRGGDSFLTRFCTYDDEGVIISMYFIRTCRYLIKYQQKVGLPSNNMEIRISIGVNKQSNFCFSMQKWGIVGSHNSELQTPFTMQLHYYLRK